MDSAPGNLLFETTPEALAEVKEVLAEIRLGKWLEPGEGERRQPAELLPLGIFLDFEVDDLMAIAQLWQWNLERRDLKGSRARPVIIFAADFAHKDGCGVLEKKLAHVGSGALSRLPGCFPRKCHLLRQNASSASQHCLEQQACLPSVGSRGDPENHRSLGQSGLLRRCPWKRPDCRPAYHY